MFGTEAQSGRFAGDEGVSSWATWHGWPQDAVSGRKAEIVHASGTEVGLDPTDQVQEA